MNQQHRPLGMVTESPAVYVALGDSISIDEYAGGPGRGGASLFARNRDDDFPEWRGRDLAALHPGLQYHLLAMDGGTTQTLLDLQLPRLERSGVAPTVVTLTVGGNDLLQAYGDTHRAYDVVQLVGTVYDPSDGSGDTSRLGLPKWPQAGDVLEALNTRLRTVAELHGARLADIHGHFLGHGLQAGDPAQGDRRPDDRDLWYCNVIEPNAWGANGVRTAFWQALHPAIAQPARRTGRTRKRNRW